MNIFINAYVRLRSHYREQPVGLKQTQNTTCRLFFHLLFSDLSPSPTIRRTHYYSALLMRAYVYIDVAGAVPADEGVWHYVLLVWEFKQHNWREANEIGSLRKIYKKYRKFKTLCPLRLYTRWYGSNCTRIAICDMITVSTNLQWLLVTQHPFPPLRHTTVHTQNLTGASTFCTPSLRRTFKTDNGSNDFPQVWRGDAATHLNEDNATTARWTKSA